MLVSTLWKLVHLECCCFNLLCKRCETHRVQLLLTCHLIQDISNKRKRANSDFKMTLRTPRPRKLTLVKRCYVIKRLKRRIVHHVFYPINSYLSIRVHASRSGLKRGQRWQLPRASRCKGPPW